jgi:hypothetical protein
LLYRGARMPPTWSAATTEPFTDDAKAGISRLTYVLSVEVNGIGRAALTAILGPAMENPDDAPSALNLLERIAGDLMSTRGGHDVTGLRNDLIGRGAKLVARPDYRDDIDALKAFSVQTEENLRPLEVVEADVGAPVGIVRHCQPAVNAAALSGNLLIIGVKAQIDAGVAPDETLRRQAEGNFAQGVHRLVLSDLLSAETAAETVTTIVGWIEFACRSTNPETAAETEAQFESSQSWGSPSARLEGAEAVLDLGLKRPEVYPAVQPLIDRMLIDPHPAVRMNAADHLARIWDLDRQGFWERAARIVAEEQTSHAF